MNQNENYPLYVLSGNPYKFSFICPCCGKFSVIDRLVQYGQRIDELTINIFHCGFSRYYIFVTTDSEYSYSPMNSF